MSKLVGFLKCKTTYRALMCDPDFLPKRLMDDPPDDPEVVGVRYGRIYKVCDDGKYVEPITR